MYVLQMHGQLLPLWFPSGGGDTGPIQPHMHGQLLPPPLVPLWWGRHWPHSASHAWPAPPLPGSPLVGETLAPFSLTCMASSSPPWFPSGGGDTGPIQPHMHGQLLPPPGGRGMCVH